MSSQLLSQLQRRVLLLDGAMGSAIQVIDLDVQRDYLGHENCVDLLVKSRPELIEKIHTEFLDAGADMVETDTFGANKLVFAEFGEELIPLTRQINREAAQIARAACEKYTTAQRPRFVLGSMGPGTKLITLGQTTWEEMLDSYLEQAR